MGVWEPWTPTLPHPRSPTLPHLPMLDTVLSTIRRYSMITQGDKVLVAVSGGPDSVALLHALWSLRDELGITLHVAHLNHSFRGEASDADAEYVRGLAESLNIPATIEKVDVPRVRRTLRLSPEEAARLVRYEFLDRVADEVGASKIALGHTADDQVETVLMCILRGTGIDGLRGMPPVRGRIIRPLIDVHRSEVEEYVREHDLHPRTDETNLMPTFTRNRIRLELLPLLRRLYNPGVDSAILQLSELAREDVAYLEMAAQEAFKTLSPKPGAESLTLDAAALAALPTAIGRRVIRRAVRFVRRETKDIGLKHVDALLSLLRSSDSFRYELPGRTFVERSGKTLTILSRRSPDEPMITYRYDLAVPGETQVPEVDAVIRAEVSDQWVNPVRPPGSMEAVFDLDAIVGTLVVRNWQPGDRIRPLGMDGTKKLHDVFIDGGIPRSARCRIPIVADDVKTVWVPGLVVSQEARVTEHTRRFLLLEVQSAGACGRAV